MGEKFGQKSNIMKLLLITCIEEFEKEVRKILNHSGVKSFSLQSVKGYKNENENELENWFPSDDIPIESLLFTVFISQECTEELCYRIEAFNEKQESSSRIHLAVLAIDKSI